MSESNEHYTKMLGYRDDTTEVQCMVSNVVGLNFKEVNEVTDSEFLIGEWFMSVADKNHNVKIHGPYETMEQAMEYARKTLAVTSFRSTEWD
ncbi:hypothetical protein [uncultured Vibrio sp.]|uniref:hypothetical protein n=1 Tax=uncultured Vibrio sp. TaxID=114054 RepID=UPI00091C1458|nr:hypothetical protein [uncultured Vibrio sp.]OIQ26358.1 MAG: hypothetical protein BM561_00930 [Vibrio sp. MedPE-SWchi]